MKKPFDLNRALAGEPVVTRDGREVKELHQFKTAIKGCELVGLVDGNLRSWFKSGAFRHDGISVEDLFMKAAPLEVWYNIYQEGNRIYVGNPFPSEEAADRSKGGDSYDMVYVKTIKITNEI